MQDVQQILACPDLTSDEGFNFFRGEGVMNNALRRLTANLDKHGIDYNLIGAIALNLHGYQRFTIDIDVLLSPNGLQKFQDELTDTAYPQNSSTQIKGFDRPMKTYRTAQPICA